MKDILSVIFRRSKDYEKFTYKQRFRVGLFICFVLVPLISFTGAFIYIKYVESQYMDCYEDKDKDGFGAQDVLPISMHKKCVEGYVDNNLDPDDTNNDCATSNDEACKVYDLSIAEITTNDCMCVDGGIVVGCNVKNSGKNVNLKGVLVTFYPDSTDISKSKKKLITLNTGEDTTLYFPKITTQELSLGYHTSKIKATHIKVTEDKDDKAIFPLKMLECKEYLLSESIGEKDTLFVQYVINEKEEEPCYKKLSQQTNKLSLRSDFKSAFIGSKAQGGNLSRIEFADVQNVEEVKRLEKEQEEKEQEEKDQKEKDQKEKERLKREQQERERKQKQQLAQQQKKLEEERLRLQQEQKQQELALLVQQQKELEEKKQQQEQERIKRELEEQERLEEEQRKRRELEKKQQAKFIYTAPDVCYTDAFNYSGMKYTISSSVSRKSSNEIENLVRKAQTEITTIKNGGMGGTKKRNEKRIRERNSWINQYCKILMERSLNKY